MTENRYRGVLREYHDETAASPEAQRRVQARIRSSRAQSRSKEEGFPRMWLALSGAAVALGLAFFLWPRSPSVVKDQPISEKHPVEIAHDTNQPLKTEPPAVFKAPVEPEKAKEPELALSGIKATGKADQRRAKQALASIRSVLFDCHQKTQRGDSEGRSINVVVIVDDRGAPTAISARPKDERSKKFLSCIDKSTKGVNFASSDNLTAATSEGAISVVKFSVGKVHSE